MKEKPPDSIIDLIKKVHELSVRGIAGEKDAAKRKLDMLMAKYNLTLGDLEDTVKKEPHRFICKNELELKLLTHCYAKIFDSSEMQTRDDGEQLWVELSNMEYIDMNEMYNHYLELWKKEIASFFSAYIHKHDLFPATNKGAVTTEEDPEETRRLISMMRTLKDGDYSHQKKLEE